MNGYTGFTPSRQGAAPCETHRIQPRGRGSDAISSYNLICANARRISNVISTSLEEHQHLPIEIRAQWDYDEINELCAGKSLTATRWTSSPTK
mmetsp:Transcript_10347/g.10428  ORF Transcript_10347/g.10428 Transcript_10347/m.10428 type:complete len:93 (-) Transcript_10347:63-341(-)